MRALWGVLLRPIISRPLVTQAKSGAESPGLSCGPTSVSGLPLNVTALARFCMAKSPLRKILGNFQRMDDEVKVKGTATSVWPATTESSKGTTNSVILFELSCDDSAKASAG